MPVKPSTHSPEALVARLQEVAARLGRRDVSLPEFQAATGISSYQVARAIGNFTALRAAAGLNPPHNLRLDDEVLLRALRDACLQAGGVPLFTQAERFGAHGTSRYTLRWRNWRGTLRALRAWVEANDPDFPYLAMLPKDGPPPGQERCPPPAAYGAPLRFGAMMHEPTNEHGVMLLFGMMADQLGFAVERVGPAFPDCEAKQRVAAGWRRVRIEFEFQSRNFHQHKHDPDGCDLIVCWNHNWPEAPIEVLELKEKTRRISRELDRDAATTSYRNPTENDHVDS